MFENFNVMDFAILGALCLTNVICIICIIFLILKNSENTPVLERPTEVKIIKDNQSEVQETKKDNERLHKIELEKIKEEPAEIEVSKVKKEKKISDNRNKLNEGKNISPAFNEIIQAMQNDIDLSKKDDVELFEKEQEETAIISYKELLKLKEKNENKVKNSESKDIEENVREVKDNRKDKLKEELEKIYNQRKVEKEDIEENVREVKNNRKDKLKEELEKIYNQRKVEKENIEENVREVKDNRKDKLKEELEKIYNQRKVEYDDVDEEIIKPTKAVPRLATIDSIKSSDSEFISPIFGRMDNDINSGFEIETDVERPQGSLKVDFVNDEIENNDFLNALKEFRKNL